MKPSLSPWIHQFRRSRPLHHLQGYHETDIAVIGGGIAGVATAFFLLRETSLRVTLLEADRIGHGATGHNAGQVLAKFERPLKELVQEFGAEDVCSGVRALESAWDLLDLVRTEAGVQTPLWPCLGYNGFTDPQAIFAELENQWWRREAQLPIKPMLIDENASFALLLDKRFRGLWRSASTSEIAAALEAKSGAFLAAQPTRVGCTNSGQTVEEVVHFLEQRYGRVRFRVYEESPVKRLQLHQGATIEGKGYSLRAQRVVLATNGFEQFQIQDGISGVISTKFHVLVSGVVSYMQGFSVPEKQPFAASYIETKNPSEDPYYYLTRRPFAGKNPGEMLVCLGGPERTLADTATYHRFGHIPQDVLIEMGMFIKKTRVAGLSQMIPSIFSWHGLMGYTPSRVRCIGSEPCNQALLYNIGCNGIGILSSIYGGKAIAGIINGKDDGVNLFRPKDQRCVLPPQTRSTKLAVLA